MALLWGIWGNRGLIPTRSQSVQTSVFLQERRCHVHGLRSLIGPGAAKYVRGGGPVLLCVLPHDPSHSEQPYCREA